MHLSEYNVKTSIFSSQFLRSQPSEATTESPDSMNHLQIFMIVVVCFFFHVKAQDKLTSGSGQGALSPFHPRLAVVIGIVSITLSVMFIILAYAKFCQQNAFNLFHQHQAEVHGVPRSWSRYSGFDESTINALPFFRFSSLKGSKEGLECAICISRFEDEEILRLLPKCKHAFHKNCIDQWLKSHSSCPLCRYKFYPDDLKTLTYSKSLRYLRNPSNRLDDFDLEITVQREQDNHQGSSRFNLSSRFYKGKKEDLLLVQDSNHANGRKDKILDKFRHKIVVSDVIIKNRWSDVNSSDLMSLKCEMLREMSSSRLYPLNSSSARLYNCLSKSENMEKIKEDIERKRLHESKITGRSTSASTSSNDENSSKLDYFPKKRSMSEISKVSRFREFSMKDKFKESASPSNVGKEERTRRLWLPIAERTVRWLENRERNSKEFECKLPASHV